MATSGHSDEDLTGEIKIKVGPHRGDRGPLLLHDVASSELSACEKEIGWPRLNHKNIDKFMFSLLRNDNP